jgi:type VI secretion system secreted protein VgrG
MDDLGSSLQFVDGHDPGFTISSFMFQDELSSIFTLSITVQATDACIEMATLVGKRIVLTFGHESVLARVTGIIREVRALTSEPTGTSYYLLSVVPPLWLTTRRVNYRIFQDRTAPEIVRDVLADYGSRISAPVIKAAGKYRRRTYTAQYGETDYDFISRILADEGITTFFNHEDESQWTLIDPASEQAPEHAEAIPFVPQSLGNAPPVPSIQTVEVTGKLKTSVVSLQDFDHHKPDFAIKARETADGAELYVDEQGLDAQHFAVGDVRTTAEASERAKRLLEATRVFGRRLLMTINTAIGAGTRITVSGHPRDDVNKPLLVTRATFVAQDRTSSQQIECIDKDTPFRPRHIPPPKIIGTQTARVVPQTEGKEIDANALGEVMVRFHWDRRDKRVNTSRFVRVSQAWAGQDYGLVCLPRVGDEVVVDFLDGDPDEPVIIGRLHNGVNVRPHGTADEQTVSVWRSRSSPGGDGYNEILLDDKAGAERLDLHAQHDYKRIVEHDSTVYVKHNDFLTVDYNKSDRIKRAYSKTAGSVTISTGPYVLLARTIKEDAKESVFVKAGDSILLECGASFILLTPDSVVISAPMVRILGDAHISLKSALIDLN